MQNTSVLKNYLSDDLISECIDLFIKHKENCVSYIETEVLLPNLDIIDAKLASKNNAASLAYEVYYAMVAMLSSTPNTKIN